jgi:hypothetical protein
MRHHDAVLAAADPRRVCLHEHTDRARIQRPTRDAVPRGPVSPARWEQARRTRAAPEGEPVVRSDLI